MNKTNVKWWTLAAVLLAACPSLFCALTGAAAFGDAAADGASLAVGFAAFGLADLLWLLPLAVWLYGRNRPAPPPKPKPAGKSDAAELYSPFAIDPYFDADMDAPGGNDMG
ncbi:MAG: hypothetical protein HF973_17155 [Chloroflexi bacterium]|nr:hypothetical protein [Chloroflexota bacterium]